MIRRLHLCFPLALLLFANVAIIAQPTETTDPRHADAMRVDEVRVGMTGYGQSVFHGDTIEAFPFVVRSVIHGNTPGKAVIWVECTGPRMKKSGPVQGMSGSPMYLWTPEELASEIPPEIGEGGRLIGAFAFGFTDTNVCLVGVQPIHYMRDVGRRAADAAAEAEKGQSQSNQSRRISSQDGSAMLAQLLDLAEASTARASQSVYSRAAAQLLPDHRHSYRPKETTAVRLPGSDRLLQPLALPLAMPAGAEIVGPLLRPMGFEALQAGGRWIGGPPPPHVDAETVKLRPGSVLSVPLGFGDLDLSAAGTVTEVMPDGTVLAFGHAMQGMGEAALPMATGYTHFVVSRNSISFKLASSLEIVGSLLRDENVAVAGTGMRAFSTAPVSVTVDMPNQNQRTFNYEVVNAPPITPAILAAVTAGSIASEHEPPMLQTLSMKGEVVFSDGYRLDFDSLNAGRWQMGLSLDLLGPVAGVMMNPFGRVDLVSANLEISIDDTLDLATLTEAVVNDSVAQPGQTLEIALSLKPYADSEQRRVVEFTLPSDLPDGEYQLLIGGADTALRQALISDPQLLNVNDRADLFTAMQKLLDTKRDAIYVGLPRQNLAMGVGQRTLETLPSSRASILAVTPTSKLKAYPAFTQQQYPAEHVIEGEVQVSITVMRDEP